MSIATDLSHADLEQMACWLAGDFSNQEQAWENPPFFAHIRVGYHPLPPELLTGIGFYVEQAYAGHLEEPYRSAVAELRISEARIRIHNYRLLDPQRWSGCLRQEPERLQQITGADLTYLPGCDVIVERRGESFWGESEPGCGCCVHRQGRSTYLQTQLQLSAAEFCSHDRGFDPETHEQVWGALAGPFRFRKLQDWASHLTGNSNP